VADKGKSPSDYGLTKKQAADLIKLLENKAPENANYFRKLFKMKLNKGGTTMPMHGKKKSKMMSRGGAGMKKKTKYMSKGGAGMKKTKYMSRGGAARRK
jgi:hypothetical protein